MSTIYRKQGRRYVPVPELGALQHFDPHMLVIGATRYLTGRMTISACCFAQHELASAWPHLAPGTRSCIQRDLEDEFRRDDEARERGDNYLPLGHDCDRAAWEFVRRAWGAHTTAPEPAYRPQGKQLQQMMVMLAAQMDEVAGHMRHLGGAGELGMRGYDLEDAAGALQRLADGMAMPPATSAQAHSDALLSFTRTD